jgi:hypothetical protein
MSEVLQDRVLCNYMHGRRPAIHTYSTVQYSICIHRVWLVFYTDCMYVSTVRGQDCQDPLPAERIVTWLIEKVRTSAYGVAQELGFSKQLKGAHWDRVISLGTCSSCAGCRRTVRVVLPFSLHVISRMGDDEGGGGY